VCRVSAGVITNDDRRYLGRETGGDSIQHLSQGRFSVVSNYKDCNTRRDQKILIPNLIDVRVAGAGIVDGANFIVVYYCECVGLVVLNHEGPR